MTILDEAKLQDDKIKDKISMTVLSWLRILLPVILGALGWYIGQVVAPMENRISELENKQEIIIQDLVRAKSFHETNLGRLNKIIEDHESHKQQFIRKHYFERVIKTIEQDVETIEDRIYVK